jgi:uncharacterized membrane protein
MTRITQDAGALERQLAATLAYGTALGSVVIAAGLLWPVSGASGGAGIVMAGVAIFILLPVLRVALMLWAFVRQRDYGFAAVSALVLAIIGLGVVLGVLSGRQI